MKVSALLLLCFVATAAAASVAGVTPRASTYGTGYGSGQTSCGCASCSWRYTYFRNYKWYGFQRSSNGARDARTMTICANICGGHQTCLAYNWNKFTKRCYLYDDFSKDQLTYAYGVYAGYIKCT